MTKSIALLPILLLLAPGMLIGTGLATRNFRQYYPLFAILVIALVVNLVLIVWHRNKQQRNEK